MSGSVSRTGDTPAVSASTGGPAAGGAVPFRPATRQPVSANTPAGTAHVGAAAPHAAGQDGFSLLKPDAFVVGVSTGKAITGKLKGGAFLLTPESHPFDVEHGTIFLTTPFKRFSKEKALGLKQLGFGGAVSGVATFNVAKRTVEPGFGGAMTFNVGPEPVQGFLNARAGFGGLDKDGNIVPHFNGVISANAGVAFQLNRPAAAVLGGAARVLALVPPLEEAAGAAAGASVAVKAGENVAQAWGGVGWRVEVHVKDGVPEGVYYKGQKITDLQHFFRDGYEKRHEQPASAPAHGSGPAAKLHSMWDRMTGKSPWRHASAAEDGGGASGVARQWRSSLLEFGQPHLQQLPHDVRMTVLGGPQSNQDAGKAADALLGRLDPEQAKAFTARLGNPYGVDFGVAAVRQQNDALAQGGGGRPGDYDDVRDVFGEGSLAEAPGTVAA